MRRRSIGVPSVYRLQIEKNLPLIALTCRRVSTVLYYPIKSYFLDMSYKILYFRQYPIKSYIWGSMTMWNSHSENMHEACNTKSKYFNLITCTIHDFVGLEAWKLAYFPHAYGLGHICRSNDRKWGTCYIVTVLFALFFACCMWLVVTHYVLCTVCCCGTLVSNVLCLYFAENWTILKISKCQK